MQQIPLWTLLEEALVSDKEYENPFWNVTVGVQFTGPSGQQVSGEAFWDGGRTWRLRFSPEELGEWSWHSDCSDRENSGLHGRQGVFHCVPYEGDNPLYQYGALTLSEDRRYLIYADGTPFFWLADTAWNGGLLAKASDWDRYLRVRRDQGFSVVQLVSTQWRGCTIDTLGQAAFIGEERIHVRPTFFQKLDARVAAVNAHGLVAAVVLLWTLLESDPGQLLSEADAIRLARYMVARWGAYQVVWFLGGDGRYEGEKIDRWKRVGRAALGETVRDHSHRRLATMHPCGQSWAGELFRNEPWFDFIGYQSGHGDSDEHLRWLVDGPVVANWDNRPTLPVINLEPNYETHPGYHSKRPFGGAEVRRAAYWSLLLTPPVGISYGHNSIWVWPEQPRKPDNHPNIDIVSPWSEALETPGIRGMVRLRRFFESFPWWRLRPAQELLVEQPGDLDPNRFTAVARSADDALVVAYLPVGGTIRLRAEGLNGAVRWFNPRVGEWMDGDPVKGGIQEFVPPDESDWMLVIAEPG